MWPYNFFHYVKVVLILGDLYCNQACVTTRDQLVWNCPGPREAVGSVGQAHNSTRVRHYVGDGDPRLLKSSLCFSHIIQYSHYVADEYCLSKYLKVFMKMSKLVQYFSFYLWNALIMTSLMLPFSASHQHTKACALCVMFWCSQSTHHKTTWWHLGRHQRRLFVLRPKTSQARFRISNGTRTPVFWLTVVCVRTSSQTLTSTIFSVWKYVMSHHLLKSTESDADAFTWQVH